MSILYSIQIVNWKIQSIFAQMVIIFVKLTQKKRNNYLNLKQFQAYYQAHSFQILIHMNTSRKMMMMMMKLITKYLSISNIKKNKVSKPSWL